MAPRSPPIAMLALAAGTAIANAGEPAGGAAIEPERVVVRNEAGVALATIPLANGAFAVSYRNSLYGTLAEERYRVLPGGHYRLVEIAADQLAVIEEYYAVPGPPRPAAPTDRRSWVAPPDPAHPLVLERLSIAATALGERTLHVPGQAPLALWRLVEDARPFVVLEIEGKR